MTFALEAIRRGKRVVVLESEAQVAGFARTLVFGHRFCSSRPDFTGWIADVMGGDLL